MTKNLENPKLVLLDCCHSDYFRGHKNLTLIAHVTNETTVAEVIDQIVSDANDQELNPVYCGFDADDLERAVVKIKDDNKEKLHAACFPDLPDYGEDDETTIAFFTVTNED